MRMISRKLVAGLAAFVLVTLPCTTAPAFFHLWEFSEVFSDAEGNVQFIELHTFGTDETAAAGATIRSVNTGQIVTLPTNLTGPTTNKSLLLATAGFESLPGAVPPDFPTVVLPPLFFFPNGDTIKLDHHGLPIDEITFTSVPTDGIMSRVFPSNTTEVNSPTNYAGQSGSVDVSILAGDYNDNDTVDTADYVVWRENLDTLNLIPNDTTPHWVMQEDYDVWRQKFGNTASGAGLSSSLSAAAPEPTTACLLLFALMVIRWRRLARPTLRRPPPLGCRYPAGLS